MIDSERVADGSFYAFDVAFIRYCLRGDKVSRFDSHGSNRLITKHCINLNKKLLDYHFH